MARIGTIDLARNALKKVEYQMFTQLNYIEVSIKAWAHRSMRFYFYAMQKKTKQKVSYRKIMQGLNTSVSAVSLETVCYICRSAVKQKTHTSVCTDLNETLNYKLLYCISFIDFRFGRK